MELQKLYVTLALRAQEYKQGLQEAAKEAQGFASQVGGKLDATFGAIRKAGTVALLGVGVAAAAGFGMAAREAVGMNATLETSTLQFATLMGSADKAQEHVAGLFEFAAKTPFETGPIIAASKHLQVFGGEALNSMDNLTLVGDAAAALGVPFDEAAFWIGRLYSNLQGGQPFGEAAMRLQEMGIMTPQARQELEAMQKAGVAGTEIFAAFQGQLGAFTGAMEDQAGTWVGLTSTIRDQLGLISAQALRPVFDVAKDALAGLVDFFNSAEVQRGVESFAVGLGETAKRMTEFVTTAVVPFVRDHGPQMIQVIKGIAVALATLYVISIISGMLTTLIGLMGAITAAGGGIAGVAAIFGGPVVLGVMAVVAALGLLAAAIVTNKDLMQELADAGDGFKRAQGFVDELTQAYRDGAIELSAYRELEDRRQMGDYLSPTGEVVVAGNMTLLDFYKQMKVALDAGAISQATYNRLAERAEYHYAESAEELRRYTAQMTYGAGMTGEMNRQAAEEEARLAAARGQVNDFTGAMANYVDVTGLGIDSSEMMAAATATQAAELAAAEQAAAKAAAAIAAFNAVSGDYRTPLPQGDKPLVAPAATTNVVTGGLTTEQRDLLADYGDLAQRAQEEIFKLTNGVGTFGMAQEEVNKRISEAQGEMEHYQALMAPLEGVVGSVSVAHRDLAVNTDAVYTALYKEAEAAGATPEALIALGLATGIMTEAQAEAALKAAALQQKIVELGQKIAEGLPVNLAMADLGRFIDKLTGADGGAGVIPAAQDAKTEIAGLPGEIALAAAGVVQPATDLGANVATAMGNGISQATQDAKDAAQELGEGVIDSSADVLGIQSPSTVFLEFGHNIVQGLIDGVWDKAGELTSALEGIINGAVQWVKNLLGIASPSTVFAAIGLNIADGLIAGLREGEDPILDTIGGIMSRVMRVAQGAAKEFTRVTLDPITDAISANTGAMGPAVARLRFLFGDYLVDDILNERPERMLERLRYLQQYAQNAQQFTALDDVIRLAEERNRLEAEYVAQQERLKQLEEQRAQIDFLNTQLELIKLIKDNKLDTAILDGLELGINANAGNVLDAMIAAMAQLVQAANDELQIASPSAVFEGVGGNIMAGLAKGLIDNYGVVDDFFAGLSRNMENAASMPALTGGGGGSTDNSRRVVVIGDVNVNRDRRGGDDSALDELFWGSR